jgi:hypothetical protein
LPAEFDPVTFQARPGSDAEESLAFIRVHWTATGVVTGDGSRLWVCDRFDPVGRVCLAHEDRPPVCRNYPWYGREPDPGKITHDLSCSYLLDLPPDQRPEGARPLLPIVDITRPGSRPW